MTIDCSYYEDVIPDITLNALVHYAEDRMTVGDFLTGVLSNDLKKTLSHADDDNMRALRDIFKFVYNRLPSECWGSPEAVKAWLR